MVIEGDESFGKLIKEGVGIKRGLGQLMEWKMKTQIVQVDNISNERIYSYAIRFFKLFLALMYSVSMLLWTAVN